MLNNLSLKFRRNGFKCFRVLKIIMKEKKAFLLISEDWRNIIFSTKESRPGYQLSTEYSGLSRGILEKSLSDLGLQYDTPISTIEYHTKVSEDLRKKKLELEELLTKKIPPFYENFTRNVIDDLEKYEKMMAIALLLARNISETHEKNKDKK